MEDNQFHIDQIVSDVFGQVKKDMGGGEFRFICPFHDDHNPSCDVNKSKGVKTKKDGSVDHRYKDEDEDAETEETANEVVAKNDVKRII